MNSNTFLLVGGPAAEPHQAHGKGRHFVITFHGVDFYGPGAVKGVDDAG